MDLFGTAGIRGDARSRITPALALAVGRAAGEESGASKTPREDGEERSRSRDDSAVSRDDEHHQRRCSNHSSGRASGPLSGGTASSETSAETRSVSEDSASSRTGGGRETTAEPAPGSRAEAVDGEEFVVGRDGRTTGDALASAVAAGLAAAGADVRRVGQVPTPALASASRGRHGVMVTASHNPPTDNGLKLFADGREYDRAAEQRIEERVDDDHPPVEWDEWGDCRRLSVLDDYRAAVEAYARSYGAPLDGLRVAVDCGNGMAAEATPQVLRSLGAEVVALNANVDGHFPGRASKPTPESLGDLRSFVADGAFAIGIAHDGDADRVVFLDGDGEVVHEDTVVAILAERYVAASDAPDPVVVTTPNASARIDERVRAADGRVERVRLGALHEGIAAARDNADEGTQVAFAAEPWKHIHPAHGSWIDGVASAAVFARFVAEAGLAELRAPVTERPYRKTSVSCPDGAKEPVMASLATGLPEAFPDADVSTEYGVRLELPDSSWVLVRPSGTEPYVRIYAESDDVDELVRETEALVERAVGEA